MRLIINTVTILSWLIATILYWFGVYEPSWWFVGVAFSFCALTFITEAVRDLVE
jgi:hypothetical protein